METGFDITLTPRPGFLEFVQDFVNRIHLPDGSSPVIRVRDNAYKTFVQAFICRSSIPFIGQGHEDNKGFELIGDALLNVSACVYMKNCYPQAGVRFWTGRKQCMVANGQGLKDLAEFYGLHNWIIGPPGEGGKKQLPNIMESLIGVLCELYSFDATDRFLQSIFKEHADTWFTNYPLEGQNTRKRVRSKSPVNHKEKLSDMCAKYGWGNPRYESSQEGPPHAPTFRAVCQVGECKVCGNVASTKREAEQDAASQMLA
ncbi:hypothetical protein BC936DRAFT_138010 [Jimgerdemannia flammicorona]|uniref:DRBM domain-containing protein n=1 Tax=Jimgerdemannia flammicorona TaxID=994334 RepID=A0A433DIM6_9FUNG|nr:hypothetical protein BC936DRAFT_138010 [Jimgerdemannia flammicorona]